MTDSQTLLSQAKCYICLGITLAEALELALLAQIINGGGVAGGGLTGVVNPEGNVTGVPGQTYWNSANQSFWIKNSGTGNTGWVQLI